MFVELRFYCHFSAVTLVRVSFGLLGSSHCLPNCWWYSVGLALQDSPVVPIGRSPRTDVLLKAEAVVMEFGGCVIRLAGLYISFLKFYVLLTDISRGKTPRVCNGHTTTSANLNITYKADRGAHSYWLEKGTVEVRPDHILNLIHYEVHILFVQFSVIV